MPKDTKDKPYVSNYPPLEKFLETNNARCMWQVRLGGTEDDPTGYVEGWMFRGGTMAVIVVHAQGHGWEIYTSGGSNRIDATLEDAAKRLGLS